MKVLKKIINKRFGKNKENLLLDNEKNLTHNSVLFFNPVDFIEDKLIIQQPEEGEVVEEIFIGESCNIPVQRFYFSKGDYFIQIQEGQTFLFQCLDKIFPEDENQWDDLTALLTGIDFILEDSDGNEAVFDRAIEPDIVDIEPIITTGLVYELPEKSSKIEIEEMLFCRELESTTEYALVQIVSCSEKELAYVTINVGIEINL